MPRWNAETYLRFADERTRPSQELVQRIRLDRPNRIVDLGCGPGNSTAQLKQRWPQSALAGVDSSAEMIAVARATDPTIEWTVSDLATWTGAADLIFSNAAIHWLPDHGSLLPRLLAQVAAGGALAFQVPANLDSPAQRLMRELSESASWRAHFANPAATWFVHEPSFYYDLLVEPCARLDLWTTEYFHVLETTDAIVDWYRGTGLRPYLERLDGSNKAGFLQEYARLLPQFYPTRTDGRVLFPFRRLFLIAYR